MTSKPNTTPAPAYRIGVLLLSKVQLLDLSPIDLFGMLSTTYISTCPFPAPLQALAHPNIQISYIASSGPNSFADTTAQVQVRVTHALDSEAVAPGKLDVLMIPGPEPGYIPSKPEVRFIQDHNAEKDTVVISICTGIYAAAYAGILDGKVATGPRGLLGDLKKKFNEPRWVEKRWVRTEDGMLWTSAGITNGQDMVAEYLNSPGAKAKGVSNELADLVRRMAEIEPRGQEYERSSASEGGWWVWLIVRSWWKGGRK